MLARFMSAAIRTARGRRGRSPSGRASLRTDALGYVSEHVRWGLRISKSTERRFREPCLCRCRAGSPIPILREAPAVRHLTRQCGCGSARWLWFRRWSDVSTGSPDRRHCAGRLDGRAARCRPDSAPRRRRPLPRDTRSESLFLRRLQGRSRLRQRPARRDWVLRASAQASHRAMLEITATLIGIVVRVLAMPRSAGV